MPKKNTTGFESEVDAAKTPEDALVVQQDAQAALAAKEANPVADSDVPAKVADAKKNKVRVYEVMASAILTDGNTANAIPANERKRGQEVGSTEFASAEWEQRLLDTGAISLVREVSPTEWKAEQQERAAQAEQANAPA